MERAYFEKKYSSKDLSSAFDKGLETAFYVLEKMVGLSPEAQKQMIDELKKRIESGLKDKS